MRDLKRLFGMFGASPALPSQEKITRESVAEILTLRPRRICFASTHENALKRQEGDRWVGNFSVPFRQSVYPIFHKMTGLDLKEGRAFQPGQSPNWWRSVRDDEEYEAIHEWMENMGMLVFLRDKLALSISLGEHQEPQGGRSELGNLEYRAKYQQDEEAIDELANRSVETIRSLPYYDDADAICAVPPRQGKEFDLPTELASRISQELGIEDLTDQFAWKKEKPSLKETLFADKWDALESVEMTYRAIKSETVILVDDLYQSGITMQFVASHLLKASAKRVFGLTIVKSRRDSDNQ
jgi:hypothetical protein